MKKIISIFIVLVLAFGLIGCSNSSSKEAEKVTSLEKSHIGGAVLKEPIREKSKDIYSDSGIKKTDKYGAYTKEMIVYGITYIASDDIPDEYLLKIANTTKQIFAINENTNKELQEELLQNMYRYNAVIPVVYSEEKMADPSEILASSSICDIIMYKSQVRAMEVIEHILHTATDVGLHYMDGAKYALDEKSELYTIMQSHIDKGNYDIKSYKDMPKEIKSRILLQEFIYWGITSEWDIQKKYGTGENEWAYQTSKLMKENAPKFDKLYTDQLSTIMTAPDNDMLDALLK